MTVAMASATNQNTEIIALQRASASIASISETDLNEGDAVIWKNVPVIDVRVVSGGCPA